MGPLAWLGHVLSHILGMDNLSGPIYGFWSGPGGDLSVFTVAYALIRKHNCHKPWCLRVGRFPAAGTPWIYCRRHHPDDQPGVTAAPTGDTTP